MFKCVRKPSWETQKGIQHHGLIKLRSVKVLLNNRKESDVVYGSTSREFRRMCCMSVQHNVALRFLSLKAGKKMSHHAVSQCMLQIVECGEPLWI